ncbi:Alcohol dehydrogenase superfamily zinc-type [Fusarium albosuccineum]|uniref:Alcohol dehydrogenase superfamily zinc-type n=1 Tax=Fusarium albosuccineum TaxID=1237068 RepID=A0A8H4KZI7_9HYPO|nr:Alcohol dehydrogenase superfamily zinc-type [Fusarium albosuccineum]
MIGSPVRCRLGIDAAIRQGIGGLLWHGGRDEGLGWLGKGGHIRRDVPEEELKKPDNPTSTSKTGRIRDTTLQILQLNPHTSVSLRATNMATDYKFEGWMGEDPSSAEGHMVWKEYEPKPWEESDIDIKITHSGICGSDIHTLRAGWGPTDFPCVVGHEIVGIAVRVGSEAEGNIKVGDLVGVGAQTDSCQSRDGPCQACEGHLENYCKDMHLTYNTTYRTGGKAYGGYALYHRSPSHFVIKIPDGLLPESLAPGPESGSVSSASEVLVTLRCSSKAMGADRVVGISRRSDKREEALALGADEYIATAEDENWSQKHAGTLDLIICTVSSPKMPLQEYFDMLALDGTLVQVGIPEEPIPVSAWALVPARRRLAGSLIGSPKEIEELFQLAADKQIVPWVEKRPMWDANNAIVDMEAGRPRFRYVLVNQFDDDVNEEEPGVQHMEEVEPPEEKDDDDDKARDDE